MTREIPLTQGYVALVDDEDYDRLAKHKWSVSNTHGFVYAMRRIRATNETILMHRLIAETPTGLWCNHVNGNALDNRRANLRNCTKRDCHRNQKATVKAGKSSQFKGVCWDKAVGKWRAQIKAGERREHLGHFASEADAARAYNDAALKHFG